MNDVQGVIILTSNEYDISVLRNSVQAVDGVAVSSVYGNSFSLEREDYFVSIRQESDPLGDFDESEVSIIQSILGMGPLNSFAFEYRMNGFEFATGILVALLSVVPACFVNDHDLIASGQEIVETIRSSPSWDWRRAPAFPEEEDGEPERHDESRSS